MAYVYLRQSRVAYLSSVGLFPLFSITGIWMDYEASL